MEAKSLKETLKQLEQINTWFEEQTEVDVEKGLEKVKQGCELLKQAKKQLGGLKNEFEEVRKDLEADSSESSF